MSVFPSSYAVPLPCLPCTSYCSTVYVLDHPSNYSTPLLPFAASRTTCLPAHASAIFAELTTDLAPRLLRFLQRGVMQIVDGLFSVLVTMGVVPVIRCPKGGLAQHVAQVLAQKLREHLGRRGNLFSEGGPSVRPFFLGFSPLTHTPQRCPLVFSLLPPPCGCTCILVSHTICHRPCFPCVVGLATCIAGKR